MLKENKHRWVSYIRSYGWAWNPLDWERGPHRGRSLMWYGPAKWIKLIVIPTGMKSPHNVFTSNRSVSTSALLYMVPDRRSGHSWLFIEFRLWSLMVRADINVGQATFWLIYLLQVLPLTIAGNRHLGNKSAREDKRTCLTRDAQKSEIKDTVWIYFWYSSVRCFYGLSRLSKHLKGSKTFKKSHCLLMPVAAWFYYW